MELLPKEVERSDQASSPPGGADQHETEAADHRETSQTKSMKVRGAVSRAVGQSVLHRQDEEEGLLDKGINMAEKITGIDIDGDGDVGVAGHRAALTKKKTSIEQVFAAATLAQRSTLFHEARHEVEQDAKLTESYWLSNAFMYRAVFQRDGPDAWETRTVKFLQSKPMQTALIILLLLDVLIVFAELFLETEHPSCKVLRRTAYSCCPTELSATDISAAAALPGASAAHRLLSGVSDGLTGASMGHQGPVELHKRTCQPHTFGAPAYHVGCVMEDWAHRLHEVLGFCSLMILMSFQLEIMALIASFRGLFVRSQGYILDFVVVSLSLALQWYVLMVELGIHDPLGLAAAASAAAISEGLTPGEAKAAAAAEAVATIEELQSIILFARCWRFIRVGHGIANSMHDMMHAAKADMQTTVQQLRTALGQLEGEIPAGTSKARQNLEQVHKSLQLLQAQMHH